jgi:two-component system, chemotaxis family, CheB/CheR fusion protein
LATKKNSKPKSSQEETMSPASASSKSNSKNDLVVVGSSAGGVSALSVLVNTLGSDFPAPIVLAQHLDPQRASHLASILERHSKLPIVTVSEHGPTQMQAGTIYVVPANRHVMIEDSTVRLEGDGDGRPIPSVDRLLSSAAEAYGEHLIAVILTGSGSDGAAGAVDVKEAGGVVIIQNPRTAPYPSMPQSLPPTVVDKSSRWNKSDPCFPIC